MLSKRRIEKSVWLFIWIIILAVYLFPFVWIVMTGFRDPIDTYSWPPKFVFKPTTKAFIELFGTTNFNRLFKNSLIVGSLSTIMTLFFAAPAAYALSHLQLRGKAGYMMGLLLGRLLPPVSLVIPVYLMASWLKILDSYGLLTIMYIVFNLPFAIWLLRSFFYEIPFEVREASIVDGCSELSAFRKIILPLSSGGIATTAVFTFIACWNEFMFALALTNFKAQTLPVMILSFRTQFGIQWGKMGATAMVITIPVIIFALIMQKYLVRGMTMGAIK